MATTRKSKGCSLGLWIASLASDIGQKEYHEFIGDTRSAYFWREDKTPAEALKEIYLLIEGGEADNVLIIYPMSKRSKYGHLLKYSGYSERIATDRDIKDKSHCMHTQKPRIPKDRSTPLFGDLPEVRRQHD